MQESARFSRKVQADSISVSIQKSRTQIYITGENVSWLRAVDRIKGPFGLARANT